MTIVPVKLNGNGYDIVVEAGLLSKAGGVLSQYTRGGQILVISDTNVAEHIWPVLEPSLKKSGITACLFILPAGEGAKSWSQLELLTDWLLANHAERSDHIIALGGGVVGDITGFAAHIIKRGCHFIQIPTSLLAQVDSSVGGKTAINSRAGKNLIGAFHQPSLVLIDPDVLGSLPKRELAAGFAEIVKYGLIDDPDFFAYCETNLDAFFNGDAAVREAVIVHCVTAKARIVAADERELNGTRALLNLGHTFGHALEAETGFSDRLLHGEAVAAGMALAFAYSAQMGYCASGDAARVAQLLRRAGLPANLHEAGAVARGDMLIGHMLHDKKMASGVLPFLLARGIGRTFLDTNVDLNHVSAFLDGEAVI